MRLNRCNTYLSPLERKKWEARARRLTIILYDLIKHFQDAEVEVESETLKFPFKSSITSLAVSNDSVIAIGTSAGAIQILYGGLETEKPQRLLKWHIDHTI